MYNCHLDTQPGDLGPFKGCYSVTSTERSFSPRSKKRLETSKHPLNGGSGIFLFELIGINRGMIEKVGQNLSPKIKQVGYRRSKCRCLCLSSGRIKDRTRETAEIEPIYMLICFLIQYQSVDQITPELCCLSKASVQLKYPIQWRIQTFR